MSRAPLPFVCALLLVACDGGDCGFVAVDVRSDYVPGAEVVEATVRVGRDGELHTLALEPGDDLLGGLRVVERDGIEERTLEVSATLRGPDGTEVARRLVNVSFTCTTAVQIGLMRSCEGVICPGPGDPEDATECVDRRCVPPTCEGETCAGDGCEQDADCPEPTTSCARSRCLHGSCFEEPDDASCRPTQTCRLGVGCVSIAPRDGGAPDAGAADAGVDAGPPCACSPGEVQSVDCGTCGRRRRECAGCAWGPFEPCEDFDSRCTQPDASYCINDYCWGWEPVYPGGIECIDLGTDYVGGSSIYGEVGQTVVGRPGATWTKQNRQTSCGGDWADGSSGTIGPGGSDTEVFGYGASTCDNTTLGAWESRIRIDDADGSTFLLPTVEPARYHNTTCLPDRRTCAAAATYCPP